MTAAVGNMALSLALVLAVWGFGAAVIGARARRPALVESSRTSSYSMLGLTLIAAVAMELAILSDDFSLRYVAANSSRATPTFFKVLSLWGADEGSLLLWNLVLAGYIAAVAFRFRDRRPETFPWAMAVLYGVAAFFLLLVLGPTRPFADLSPVPADGRGPLPLLQNHPLMAAHPPTLYLGFIGFTVPFAFALAALISGRLSDEWIRTTRRWTLASWIFMTLGLLLGGLWSYGVLGWGGYWAWDPVENVSLLPWLTATAFLHSVMAEERRGMLKVWNLSLVVGTFALTIFGTFLTRGSILYSVHAFAQSIVGPLYLGFLTLVLLVGFGLIALRSQLLRSERTFDTPFSRESTFLGNNLLLIVLTFTVFLGTIYPLIAEATAARQVSVGGPYFNRTTVPVVILLLGLMSVGPLLPWRAGSASRLGRRLQAPAWAGALTLAGLSAAGISNLPALLALGFAAFAAVATVSAMLQSIRSLKSASGLPLLQAAIGAVRRNRRFHGGMIVHLGLVLVAIAVTVSSSFDRRTEATIGLGETFVFAGYGFRFEGVRQIREPHRRTVAAELSLLEDAQKVARLTPLMNFYPSSKEPIGTPSIRTGIPSNLFRDVYVSVSSIDNDKTTASFRIYVNPGVNWLWFGGALMMLGAILAAWPSRRVRFLTPIPEPRPERVEVIR